MKALFSIITLLAIFFAYFFSASFYLEGQFWIAYSLVLASIAGLSLWIKSHDLLQLRKA